MFVNERSVALDGKRLNRPLKKHGIEAVPHGFRSSFRDWAAEKTDHPREVVEAALAHVVKYKVEAAYRRTDLFERRRRLMDDWSVYLTRGAQRRGSLAGQLIRGRASVQEDWGAILSFPVRPC
ncbi:hypothetical protein [Candidatus Palauibacter polyketidifaciens]|uniref:hypothetical protein n=1 Tax=Candidatus Palauibacter polyketidifaciens TaxID=3056740 RepID=UPI00238DFCA9|nr:hypothetical protein [Candidatus Palauibacter polyketidifaciens]MDE2720478.1 hypothetical protein [Candidatus Palauibacter polyketidifaciens]